MEKTTTDPMKLTLRDAWITLATWWDDPKPCKCGHCGGLMTGSGLATGLCASISVLAFRKFITPQVEDEMRAALPNRGPTFVKGVRAYQWPTTIEGAKERADFCRRQAELCD